MAIIDGTEIINRSRAIKAENSGTMGEGDVADEEVGC